MARTDRGRPPTWTRFAGIGIEFAGVVVGFTLIGLWIDRHYNKSPWGVITGVSLGLIGGMYNLIRESLKASKDAASGDKSARDGGTDS